MKKGDKVIIIKENLYFNVGTVCELLGKGWDRDLLLGINKHGKIYQAYIYNDRYKLCKEEDLLEQARLKYPVGTKYKNAHKYAQGENTIHKIKGTDFYWHEQDVSISERSSSGIVYYLPDDRWAEITNKDQNTIPEYVECFNDLVDIGVYPYPTSNKEEFTGKLIKTKSKIKKQVIVAPQKPIRLKTIKIK